MRKYIVFLLGIVICVSSLVACKKAEPNIVTNINDQVTEVEEKKLADILDEEILDTINEGYKIALKIGGSYDSNNYIDTDINSIFQIDGKSRFYKTKEPYDTPEKIEEALKKYFLKYDFYTQIADENTKEGAHHLIKHDGLYYFFPFAQDSIYLRKFDKVVSKEISDNKLIAILQYKYISYGYSELWFVLEDGKLKIDNISKKPEKNVKDLSDKQILATINNANGTYRNIRDAVDYSEKIERNISFHNGDSRIIEFYKVEEPYENTELRNLELSKDFTYDNILSQGIGFGIGEYQNNILYYENGVSYFHKGNVDEPYDYNYGEVVDIKYSDYSNQQCEVKVKSEDSNKAVYSKYKLVFAGPKLFVESAEIESISYKNNSYIVIKDKVTQSVQNKFKNIQGNYSIAFKDINEVDSLSINSAKMSAASTIKIYVMIEAYNQVQQGKLSLNDKIRITNEMIVGGSGLIQHEPIGTQYTIEELIRLMMVESDNTAANILIDKLGMQNINATIKSLGCLDTELNRKMMDTETLNKGIDNYTSVNDLSSTLNKLYNGECVSNSFDNKMLDIMKGHQLKSKIPNKLPQGTVVAHKSGEMGGIENDAAIVYTDKGAYILCILTDSGTSSEQVMAISDISREVYDEFMMYKGE